MNKKETEEDIRLKLATASLINEPTQNNVNPWVSEEVDKFDFKEGNDFRKLVSACRFFYKHDPLSATTVNKLVDIGINELLFTKEGLSENEFKIFLGIKDKLEEFAQNMALEFLLSGLVVPEIGYSSVGKEVIKELGIKKYEHLVLPTSMWLRDPATMLIKHSMLGDKPSYFVEVPDEMSYFIRNNGKYRDGTEDKTLYAELAKMFPEFFRKVKEGQNNILIKNDLVIRRNYTTENPYPIPYLQPAIESLKHKRNLRRMDYSIASRVISAILLVKLGSDAFPLLEGDEEQFKLIQQQLAWRQSGGRDLERIYQLFSNHTLSVEWVMPPIDALINDGKYSDINQEIIFALGIPRILITGETERTGSSDPEFALMSPEKTMESFRNKILTVLRSVVNKVAKENNLKSVPTIKFAPLNLVPFAEFATALTNLYNTGNISRTAYDKYFGFNFNDEMDVKEEENKLLKSKGLEEFAPQPFSPKPNNNPGAPQQKQTNEQKPKENKPE
jgi:hypothetical protein